MFDRLSPNLMALRSLQKADAAYIRFSLSGGAHETGELTSVE